MRSNVRARVFACARTLGLALLLQGGVAHATSVVYRNPADGRAWEVVMDAAEPLVWQWAEGAVSATVTVSNVLSGRAVCGRVLLDNIVVTATPSDTCIIVR